MRGDQIIDESCASHCDCEYKYSANSPFQRGKTGTASWNDDVRLIIRGYGLYVTHSHERRDNSRLTILSYCENLILQWITFNLIPERSLYLQNWQSYGCPKWTWDKYPILRNKALKFRHCVHKFFLATIVQST